MTTRTWVLASLVGLTVLVGCSENSQTQIREAGDAVADDMKDAGDKIATEAKKAQEGVAAGLEDAGDKIATEAKKAQEGVTAGLEDAKAEVKKAGQQAIDKSRDALDQLEKTIDDSDK